MVDRPLSSPRGFGTWLRRAEPVYALHMTGPAAFAVAVEVGAPVGHPLVPFGKSVAPAWDVGTKHGPVPAEWGDWLLTDGKGDWWPVKADIFAERYYDAETDPAWRIMRQAKEMQR